MTATHPTPSTARPMRYTRLYQALAWSLSLSPWSWAGATPEDEPITIKTSISDSLLVQSQGGATNLQVMGPAGVIDAGAVRTRLALGTYLGELTGQTTFTIENLGSQPLVLTGAPAVQLLGSDANQFTVIEQPGQLSLLPGESTQFTVAYNPNGAGHHSTQVVIFSNAPDMPLFEFKVAAGLCTGDYHVTEATDDGTGLMANSLSWAIFQANQTPGHQTITIAQDVTLTGVPKRLINSDVTLTSAGPVVALDGDQSFRPLFIKSGQVTIERLDLRHGKAKGGQPAETRDNQPDAGGGAGMGAGLFIYGGQVTLRDSIISHSQAAAPSSIIPLQSEEGRGGGGLFFTANSQRGTGGAGLFAESDSYFGGYGGYGHYQQTDPSFGRGGNGDGLAGGFGAGGGFNFKSEYQSPIGGDGGFGGGGGGAYSYHDRLTDSRFFPGGGLGGFGGGGDHANLAGFGATKFGAAMGGAVFVRSGQIRMEHVTMANNEASPNGDSMGLGGAIFIVHTTEHDNGNNQGMPTALAEVSACRLTLTGNSARDDAGTPLNNDDVFDLGQRMNRMDHCPPQADAILIFKADFDD